MDDERIDFSPLDPAADRLRFERLVRGVMAKARPPGLFDGVARYGRRALLVAAGLALLAWVPTLGQADDAPAADAVTQFADLVAQGNARAAAAWYVEGGADE